VVSQKEIQIKVLKKIHRKTMAVPADLYRCEMWVKEESYNIIQ